MRCNEWKEATNEADAFNGFAALQRLPCRPEPQLRVTLTRHAVDEWLDEIRAHR